MRKISNSHNTTWYGVIGIIAYLLIHVQILTQNGCLFAYCYLNAQTIVSRADFADLHLIMDVQYV